MDHQFGSMTDLLKNPKGEIVANSHMRDFPHPGWIVFEDNSMRCKCGVHFEDHQKRRKKCANPPEKRIGRPREHSAVLG